LAAEGEREEGCVTAAKTSSIGSPRAALAPRSRWQAAARQKSGKAMRPKRQSQI